MPTSARVRTADVRAIYAAVGECRDLGDAAGVWWPHAMHRAAELADADLALGGEMDGFATGRPVTVGHASWGWDHGFNPAGWVRCLAELKRDPRYSVQMVAYAERLRADDGAACARTDLVADRVWEASTDRETHDVIGVRHTLWCFKSGPEAGSEVGFYLSRASRRADFTGRQKAVLREFTAALAPLVGGPLARFAEPSPAALSPRARAVLRCFLEGDSDKQVAARLGLSAYTVNDHAKQIYKHFGVSSRAELLALWVRCGRGGRRAWADDAT